MEFAWDEGKNRINRRKHGVSFETAIAVFDDPNHVSVQDREVDGEARWQTIGLIHGIRVLMVAHTVEEGDEEDNEGLVRVLSARKATPQERRIYAQGY